MAPLARLLFSSLSCAWNCFFFSNPQTRSLPKLYVNVEMIRVVIILKKKTLANIAILWGRTGWRMVYQHENIVWYKSRRKIIMTWKLLEIANMYWKAMVFLFIVRRPNAQETPRSGNNTATLFIPALWGTIRLSIINVQKLLLLPWVNGMV